MVVKEGVKEGVKKGVSWRKRGGLTCSNTFIFDSIGTIPTRSTSYSRLSNRMRLVSMSWKGCDMTRSCQRFGGTVRRERTSLREADLVLLLLLPPTCSIEHSAALSETVQ